MNRLKSIDIFRGVCIIWMITAHLLHWWLITEDLWLYDFIFSIFDVMGANAFIFISGVSATLSIRNKRLITKMSGKEIERLEKREYMYRSLILLFIGLLYNIPIAIYTLNISNIWIWFVLLTIAISFLLAWPLLRLPKMYRIIIAVGILILNQLLIDALKIYQGEYSIFGVLFHVLYNGFPVMDPIFTFFPFFLVGTVIGDEIFQFNTIPNKETRNNIIKKRFFRDNFVIGIVLVVFGILYKYPDFLNSAFRSFSWLIYSLGFELVLISILISFEEFEIIKTKRSYKFIYYFSYYSLSIFLGHNLLFLLFYRKISASNIIFILIGAILLIGLLLRFLHKKWGRNLSLKAYISRITLYLSTRYEKNHPSIH